MTKYKFPPRKALGPNEIKFTNNVINFKKKVSIFF